MTSALEHYRNQRHMKQVTSTLNLGRLNLLSLRLVLACAEVGSLSKAAPICHMSTMCASSKLKRLEETLGVAIFYRRRTGLELTQAGCAVAQQAKQILQAVDDLVANAANAPELIGNVYENSGRPARRNNTSTSMRAF